MPAPEVEEPVAEAEPEVSEPAPAISAVDDWDMPELDGGGDEAATADEPFELKLEAPEGDSEGTGGGDELLLDADRLAADDEPVGGGVAMPGRRRGLVSSEEVSVPEATGQGGGSADSGGAPGGATSSGGGGDAGSGSDAPAKAAPRVGGGATLFERMANLSRGGRSADDDDGDDDGGDGPSISIPRFLGRQNNQ